jgi:hypothetical protein
MLSFYLAPLNHAKVSQSEKQALCAGAARACYASMSKPCASTLMKACVNADRLR